MSRLIHIGMDVHTTNYTLYAAETIFCDCQVMSRPILFETVKPDVKYIVSFVERIKKMIGDDCIICCGYEAGCLGYSLYRKLTKYGIKCVILAPSTMLEPKSGKRIKTDARDAKLIADCMASPNGCSYVYIPTQNDDDIKCYLRMRDDHKIALKKIKQQINAFCLVQGYHYEKTKWTEKHLRWLRTLELKGIVREILNEYLITYNDLDSKLERFEERIEEFAARNEYAESVKNMCCFLGIKTHTALSLLVEIGDFNRFKNAQTFSAFLGLVPDKDASGNHDPRMPITKAGNKHCRTLLTESCNGIRRGAVGYKSKELRARQKGRSPEVIAYADKCNERLRRKYQKMIHRGKNSNVATTAIARELACFIWGMMTGNIGSSKMSPVSQG